MGVLEKFVALFFSKILGKWLQEHPQVEAYFWPITVTVFLGGVISAVIYEALTKPVMRTVPVSNDTLNDHPSPSPRIGPTSSVVSALAQVMGSVQPLKVGAASSLRIPLLISVGFLLCAIVGKWPYDFFVLLRVVVCTTCIIAVGGIWKARTTIWLWVLIATAVIYNPLLPIHLHQSTWIWLNWAALFAVGVLCSALKSK